MVEPTGTWTVRLAAGLANDEGDGFADVPLTRGAKPGQPNVYNLAFRTHEQEKAHLNFWSDEAQADALTDGNVSEFSLAVRWDQLADRLTTDEPVVRGTSTRWYVSSVELGQGVADSELLSTDPVFLGRVQPYSVCLPATYAPGRKLPLTLLLHSLALGQNQFAAIGPRLLHQICDDRDSVVVTPLARGPSCWYFDEGELDVWEVWARVAEQLGTDPNRTVICGLLDGRLWRLQTGADLSGGVRSGGRAGRPADLWRTTTARHRHSRQPGPALALCPRGRHLAAARQRAVVALRHRPRRARPVGAGRPRSCSRCTSSTGSATATGSPSIRLEDHITWVAEDEFDDPVSHMGTGPRQGDPGHITFTWYPELVRPDLGIGPHQVWWLSDLTADPATAATRGAIASVDARSHARPDPTRTAQRRRGVEPDLDLSPGLYTELTWRIGSAVDPLPFLTLQSHPRRGRHRGCGQGRACVVAHLDDQRCD